MTKDITEVDGTTLRGPDGKRLLARDKNGYSKNSMTAQQKLFVEEYLIDLSPKNAAIRAGYDPDRANRIGHSFMKEGSVVRNAIDMAMAARSARVGITADRVLRELGKLAFGDSRCVFDEHGQLRPPSEMTEEDAQMVAGVKTRRIVEVGPDGLRQVEIQEVQLVPKTKPLDMIMRHLGMYNDKVTVVTPLADQLDAAMKRINGGEAIPVTAEMVEDAMEDEEGLVFKAPERPVLEQDDEDFDLKRMLGEDE